MSKTGGPVPGRDSVEFATAVALGSLLGAALALVLRRSTSHAVSGAFERVCGQRSRLSTGRRVRR